MSQTKPFIISKWDVVQAYRRVKANRGAAGVDNGRGASVSLFGDTRRKRRNLWKKFQSRTPIYLLIGEQEW